MARPRSFIENDVIEAALDVFLAKGYEGASVSDLTAAMGINPPSLYAAFGSKHGLFRRAMEMYAERRAGLIEAAMSEPTASAMVRNLLHAYADALTEPGDPAGCLYVHGALACGDGSAAVRRELADMRHAFTSMLAERLDKAVHAGELPADADTLALGRFLATMIQGMAVQAAGGVGRRELHAVADIVAGMWGATVREPA